MRERGRERAHASREGAEREREEERIPSRLHTVSTEPSVEIKPTNHEIMTWVEIKSQMLNRLSHPSVPHVALSDRNS